MPIHPTAMIDARAEIHPEADIGPYVVVDGPVHVGPRTRVLAHATLTGWTAIGADNVIHMGAVVGHTPQDLAFTGEESYLRIGDRNVIREHVQIHRGTKPGSATEIGSDNYFMGNSHVGHNCRVGNGVIVANGALFGGYVEVEDHVFVSGNCVVHQFVRIGRLAILRGLSRTSRDVPPFCIMDATHTVRAINRVGLRRAGFTAAQIRALRNAFVRLFGHPGNLSKAIAALESEPVSAEVRHLIDFIRASKRGVCFGPRPRAAAERPNGEC
ncbi:MAG TPA: acyl-ACP--UDP-N-acetylglucosamine O-acyltransferase [Candidatus Margulisiibacteriota bacterium]|nr:acyl-ACP--UDP-N-acetylglucosamine O-acyltransferase [Candidatus Margulisiibacteriota bacterium]